MADQQQQQAPLDPEQDPPHPAPDNPMFAGVSTPAPSPISATDLITAAIDLRAIPAVDSFYYSYPEVVVSLRTSGVSML